MADRVGQQLGHYRLIRLLGRGGFAEVYLGEHQRLKTQAAIKILYTSLEENDVEGFLREAQTIARLKHPHIVRVFDFDTEEHIPFLVMDYLPNGSVRRLYSKGTQVPLATVVSYVAQIASALQYAHDEKLIHRDIKPENLLLDQDNQLMLSDFGIALIAQTSRSQSVQDIAGTAAYMAPEQFQGKPRRASDQYALGMVVYEWLTGELPFQGSFSEIASQHLFVPPPPLQPKVPHLLPEVEQVVLIALEKDADKRFASVQAFAVALEQASQIVLPHQDTLSAKVASVHTASLSPATVAASSPTQPPLLTEVVTPPPQSPKYLFSQRMILGLLALLLILGGGLTWLTLSHPSAGSTAGLALAATSTTAFTATATQPPTATPVPTQAPAATQIIAAPQPPVAPPAPKRPPAATPTSPPPPTATPIPPPPPTATPVPTQPVVVAQPTLTTDCAHLVTPWVALYQYSNYGGRELCFEGRGTINLADFGFDKQTRSVNIAASGVFSTQPNGQGTQLGFSYGYETADLGSWDNQISSFRVDG